MKKIICLVAALALFTMLFSCQSQSVYDEEGYYRVIDGSLPETLPEYPQYGDVRVGENPISLDEALERGKSAGYKSFLAIRARKMTSTSTSREQDEHLAYTITEMEILDVYVMEGTAFEEYTQGKTISIVEPYAYQWKANKPELTVTSFEIHRENGRSTVLSNYTTCDIVEPEKEYILFIKDGMLQGVDGEKLTCINSDEIIISKDNAGVLFYADMIRAIDQSAYEQMKASGYDDVASRKGGTVKSSHNYLYYDILNAYYFK